MYLLQKLLLLHSKLSLRILPNVRRARPRFIQYRSGLPTPFLYFSSFVQLLKENAVLRFIVDFS